MLGKQEDLEFCTWCDSPIELRTVKEHELDKNGAPTGLITTRKVAYNHPTECVNPKNRGHRHRCFKCKGCGRKLIHVGPNDGKKDKDRFWTTVQSDQTKKHICRGYLELLQKQQADDIAEIEETGELETDAAPEEKARA